MTSISPLVDFCNLTRMIAERDSKPWGQVISEITESLKEKDHPLTDQSKENDHENTFKDIIPQNQDIDGQDVYDLETGKTIMDIYELGGSNEQV